MIFGKSILYDPELSMKIRSLKNLFPSKYLLVLCLLVYALPATAQLLTPGNRFQYHKYKWDALHTPAFHLYFPKGCDSLASLASVQLPDIVASLKKSMGTTFKSVPNLIIYPSVDQLYESNIGMNEEVVQTFPTINLKGNRVLLAFNGSYEQFVLQLREAWARLCWEEQFKNDAAEQLTNRKQQVPSWFKKGFIGYMASGWSPRDEETIYAYFRQHTDTIPLKSLSLAEDTRIPGGKAFCYFLAQQYHEDAAKQILFQLRQGKSLPRAVRLVTKRTLDTLKLQCEHFYQQRFLLVENNRADQSLQVPGRGLSDTLERWLESRYKRTLFAIRYSPDHNLVCYTLQKANKREVYIADIKRLGNKDYKPSPFTFYTMPPWLDDCTADPYPLVEWQDKGRSVAVLMPQSGIIRIRQYNNQGNYMDVRSLYSVDGAGTLIEWERNKWLLAAYRKGKSDIVLYDGLKLNYKAFTLDDADHTQLSLSAQDGQIVYRSGYPADSLYNKDTLAKPYGIYSKPIPGPGIFIAGIKDRPVVVDSAYGVLSMPQLLTGSQVQVTHTFNGIVQTDTLSLSATGGPWQKTTSTISPWLQDYQRDKKRKDSIAALLLKLEANDVSVLRNILTPGDTKAAAKLQMDSIRKALAYTPQKVRPYLLQLYSAYFSAQVNNDYYINRYQPFAAYLGTFKFPEVGAMVQGGFSDLFENHHFNIGYRMPAGTEGSDFFVRYGNTARRLDWHFLFFRKMESLQPDGQREWKDNRGNPYPAAAKVRTHYYELGFHYPLHYDWSLDFTTAARRDRTIFLATDRYSLNYEALQAWWGLGSLSLGVNKLKPSIPFLFKGWEAKVMLDGMASTGKSSTLLYGSKIKMAWHQPLIRDITLVAQVQAGYSGGENKILYNFGGLDNNVVTRVDTSVRFGQDAPYAFQSLVTPFRGYEQNSIYGSSFSLLNLDLYFPLFRSLIPLHTSFTAVNNLQLGLFTDIATTGGTEGLPAVTSPLYAYGFSARTMLAGYPIRFDMAWPGSFDKKPVWYLSLSLK